VSVKRTVDAHDHPPLVSKRIIRGSRGLRRPGVPVSGTREGSQVACFLETVSCWPDARVRLDGYAASSWPHGAPQLGHAPVPEEEERSTAQATGGDEGQGITS